MPLYLKYEKWWNIILMIVYEVMYKIIIAYRWASGTRFKVTFQELLKILLTTTRFSLGSSKIRKVVSVGKYLRFYIKGLSISFYFPKKDYLTLLYIIGENQNPNSWHYYETKETPITKDDTVVDCGAGVGTFTISAAQKGKKVYAIEPFKESIEPLKLTFAGNKKVVIIPYAVGEKTDLLYMNGGVFGTDIQTIKTSFPVKVTTIDKLFFEKGRKITYLKADLEGFEMQMLRGARKTIKNYKPKIAITTYHKKNDHIYICNYLKKLNPQYNFYLRGIDRRHGNPIMLHAW